MASRAALLGHAYGIGMFNPPWHGLGEHDQAHEEAAARAAIAAQEPQPAPELAQVREALAVAFGMLQMVTLGTDDLMAAQARKAVALVKEILSGDVTVPEAKPAPELAAAMRETREVRDGYARLCGEFGDHSQSGQSARISLTVLNRHRKAAGLNARRPAPAGERRDPYMQLREERDELRVMLSTLTDRAEASKAITGDEADEYRTALNG
jgi:hypothetical protein